MNSHKIYNWKLKGHDGVMVAQYRKKEKKNLKSNCGFNDFSIYSLYWIHLILVIWEKVGFKKKQKQEDLNRRFGIGDLMGI